MALLVAVVGALVAFAPPVLAGHSFNGQGIAKRGDEVFRVSIGAHLLRFQEPGASGFGVAIFEQSPAVEDILLIEVVEAVAFTGRTNFIDADEVQDPLLTQTDYWAESTTEGVSFRLDGVRFAQNVVASGHFQDYEIHVGPTLL